MTVLGGLARALAAVLDALEIPIPTGGRQDAGGGAIQVKKGAQNPEQQVRSTPALQGPVPLGMQHTEEAGSRCCPNGQAAKHWSLIKTVPPWHVQSPR